MHKLLYNPFKLLRTREWILWGLSVLAVVVSNIISGIEILPLISSLIGVSALIFVSKGDVWGQFLFIFFSILYAVISYKTRYYGEMITFLGMSLPASVAASVSWIKNPYKEGEVKIRKLKKKELYFIAAVTFMLTVAFYFILKYLGTASLNISTFSVVTSSFACLLLIYRSPYYAVAYSVNDIVLIILWTIASLSDSSYISVVICFATFFANDLYGFISWISRRKIQNGQKNS